MKFFFGPRSGNRALLLSTVFTLIFASTGLAEISEGTTYDIAAHAAPATTITGAASGQQTVPGTPLNGTGFCVGPPVCESQQGMSAGYFFATGGPTGDQIVFQFAGATNNTNGDFTIDLSNFVNPDGSSVTNIVFDHGSLNAGSLSVDWNAGDAKFTGTPSAISDDFEADGLKSIYFDITETAPNPEPGSLLLGGLGLAGLAIAGIRRKRQA